MFASKRALAAGLLIAAVCLAATPTVLNPDVKYTTITTVKLEGTVGKIVNFFSKSADDPVEQTTWLKGDFMRTDDGKSSSSIVDLQNQRFISIDHERKTYWMMSFVDMMEKAEEAVTEATEEAQELPEEPQKESDVEYRFDLKVEPTGERQKISGFDAEKVYMTIRVDEVAKGAPEGQSQGAMVLASEIWLSKDAPWYAEQNEFARRMASSMGDAAQEAFLSSNKSILEGLHGAGNDPRMKEAIEKAEAEANKLDGVEVKNTTRLVLVPQGVEFSAATAFAGEAKQEEPKKKGGGLGRFARRLAEQAVAGRTSDDGGDASDETPKAVTMMTITTEIGKVEQSPIPDSAFDIPAGYSEVNWGQ